MPESDVIMAAVLGAASIASAVMAVASKNLIRAVAAFALSSAFLSALFFHLGAPYAGAVELTVGAGLVTVLFLVALVLAGREDEVAR